MKRDDLNSSSFPSTIGYSTTRVVTFHADLPFLNQIPTNRIGYAERGDERSMEHQEGDLEVPSLDVVHIQDGTTKRTSHTPQPIFLFGRTGAINYDMD